LRFGSLAHEKIILKDSLKKIPFFGWGMQHFCFLFLRRSWEQDERYMSDTLLHFAKRQYPIQLLIFPEGTDLSDVNRKKSSEFAEKNNLVKYNEVLHPRTKGFIYTVALLRKSVKYIYDITIGYPDLVPQTETIYFSGKFPKQIHFHLKRYDIKSLPETDDELAAWCNQRWKEKEALLTEFQKNKKFPETLQEREVPDVTSKKLFCFIFWTAALIITNYLLYTSSIARWYFVIAFIGEFVISYRGGSDSLEKKIQPAQ